MILERFFDYWNFNKLCSLPAATLYENHNKLIITFATMQIKLLQDK